jgi:RecB family endonuclease NucS
MEPLWAGLKRIGAGPGTQYVVELKLGLVDWAALNQLQRYMGRVRKQGPGRVKGILVCGGVMPAYEDEIKEAEGIRVPDMAGK